MTKKIAIINDLSGFGKCSLTAAISVIAAMGVQPCPLPTAVLSAQTGYPDYFYEDFTDKMESIYREWEKMGARFDGIYTGFMSGERQIGKVFDFLDLFHKKDTFLLVDPIMGDNGERFPIFSASFQSAMGELARQADIITPNLTELCLLTGTDYTMIKVMTAEKHLLTIIRQMAENMISCGVKAVVVTGIRYRNEDTGKEMMGNLAVTKDDASFIETPFIGESFSGTGDLFASVLAGGKARGDRLPDDVRLAADMIGCAVRDAVQDGIDRNEGVEYEKYLGMLMKK